MFDRVPLTLHDEPRDRAAIEALSEQFFGRACRLPLALWILHRDDPRFYQSEPPSDLGGRTAIRQELARFVDVGLLRTERVPGDTRVFYSRTQSPLWDIVRVAGDSVSAI